MKLEGAIARDSRLAKLLRYLNSLAVAHFATVKPFSAVMESDVTQTAKLADSLPL